MNEPTQVMCWTDDNGNMHKTEEEARKANFDILVNSIVPACEGNYSISICTYSTRGGGFTWSAQNDILSFLKTNKEVLLEILENI